MEEFIKNKKTIGIITILIIIIITSIILYQKNGVNELKKNDTETIFIDEGNESEEKNSEAKDSKEINTKSKKIIVEIKGEVNKPDVYSLDENSIVKDVIDLAGGVTENADLSSINRAKQVQNHELIYIANKNETIENQNNPIASSGTQDSSNLININSASIDELKKINGIGDAKAKTIIEYREKNGSFTTIEDIKNVGGIGEKMFEKIKEQITV